MKSVHYILAGLIVASLSCCRDKTGEHSHDTASQAVPADTVKKSIPKEEHVQVGAAHVMIKYHAPAVRGRTVWGGLVPYAEVWVTGAHSATSLEIDKAFTVNGTDIPAGKYALFTIPGPDTWVIIVNKNWDQHLADEYDQKEDIVRLEVIPEQLPAFQERLKYSIVSSGDTAGSVEISWEKIKVSMPFKIK